MSGRAWQGFAAAVLLLGAGSAAQAGPILDRVRADKAVRCAAVARPGLAEQRPDGQWAGLLVDLCRAAGVAVVGPAVRVTFDELVGDGGFEAVRAGRDDIVFLTGSEIVDHKLAGALLPGPTVFEATTAVMVPADAPVQAPATLAGAPICYLLGEPAERHLSAYFAARHLSFVRMGYQEDVEMLDAFDAGQCKAIAGEATVLADDRLAGGPTLRGGRIMAEPLARYPVMAASPTTDAPWAAVLAWTVATLQNADRPTRDWAAGGVDSLPIEATGLGLPAGWQKATLAAVGSYATSLRHHIGDGSPLRLPAGPNSLQAEGGSLAPPYAE